MYARPIVPASFHVPLRLEGDGFVLRPLTVNDVVKDFDAVVSSTDRLVGHMDPADSWPRGLTLEENLVDLGWHQREFTLRHSFAYTVFSPDGGTCLGCAYIYPCFKQGYDVEVYYWVRTSEAGSGLEARLGRTLRSWLANDWPFRCVAYPGRDIAWSAWQQLPAR